MNNVQLSALKDTCPIIIDVIIIVKCMYLKLDCINNNNNFA